MPKKYQVTKPFGKYPKGYILNTAKAKEALVVTRKIQEGDCIKELKQDKSQYENKMLKDDKKEEKKKGVK